MYVQPKLSRRCCAKYNMLGETDKSSGVFRTASLSEMGHEQRAATSSTLVELHTVLVDWNEGPFSELHVQ